MPCAGTFISALALRDLVLSHQLERLHEPRVIPARAAVRDARAEELLRARGVRQRKAERASAGEREVEVLLMQLDAEAGLEGEIGRASCRERGEMSVDDEGRQQKNRWR